MQTRSEGWRKEMEKAMKRVMKIVAVLDIGSNFVRMGIYQVG